MSTLLNVAMNVSIGAFLPESHHVGPEIALLERFSLSGRGMLENVSPSTLELLKFISLWYLLGFLIFWAVDRWRVSRGSRPFLCRTVRPDDGLYCRRNAA
jgi:hypothetical protein